MTKGELIDIVAKDTGVSEENVRAVIESTLANIKNTVASGGSVFMRGFGSFNPKDRKAKTARDIGKGTPILIPAKTVPIFKPANEFKNQVTEGSTSLINA